MELENLVFDAVDPPRLGRFWEAVLGAERLTDEPDAFETRLSVADGPVLDLCFQRVPEPPLGPSRLHLHLVGGAAPAAEVDRLLGLGARRLDLGQGEGPGVALADPEGNPCRVGTDSEGYADTGPLAGLVLDSADPEQDAEFWAWLTGWTAGAATGSRAQPYPTPGHPGLGHPTLGHPTLGRPTVRHPSRRGPVLQLCPEPARKGTAKNRLHLDVRLEAGEDPDAVAAAIVERGGRELHPDWGALPWRLYEDPSGNDFCVLPARS